MKRIAPVVVFAVFGCANEWLPGHVYSISMNPDYADSISQVPEPYRPEPSEQQAQAPSARQAEVEVQKGIAKIRVAVANGLAYPIDEIRIPAGTKKIEVTLVHEGNVPVTAMGHNIVFLKPGTDAEQFALASSTAVGNGYIAENMKGDILAHTKMIGGGENDTVKFTTPSPGEYVFLCSFPGHYALMNGKLIVEG